MFLFYLIVVLAFWGVCEFNFSLRKVDNGCLSRIHFADELFNSMLLTGWA